MLGQWVQILFWDECRCFPKRVTIKIVFKAAEWCNGNILGSCPKVACSSRATARF